MRASEFIHYIGLKRFRYFEDLHFRYEDLKTFLEQASPEGKAPTMMTYLQINAFAVMGSVLFSATGGKLIFRSDHDGDNWVQLDTAFAVWQRQLDGVKPLHSG